MLDFRIIGDDMQAVEIRLFPGEAVFADPGALLWMDEGVEMKTEAGGLFKGLKRKIAGESFFMSVFRNTTDRAKTVVFGEPYPGKVVALDLSEVGDVIFQRGAFLCGEKGIDINVAFTKKISAGLFGGEGFVLEKATGSGWAFFHAGGEVVKKELSEEDTLLVDTGCVVGFTESVSYGIRTVRGIRNILFGGEGLFLCELKGPGTVWLQSLPLKRLSERIISEMEKGRKK